MKKHRYKGVKGEGNNLYECLCDEDNEGGNSHSHFAQYVESEVEFYCSEERDTEVIKELLWDHFNLKELNWFAKNAFDVDSLENSFPMVNRHSIQKLLKKQNKGTKKYEMVKKLYDEFMKNLEGKRVSQAEEWAWSNLNDEMYHLSKKNTNKIDSDENMAEFFGIEIEITDYQRCDDSFVPNSDVIGFTSCNSPIIRGDLFIFNEQLKEKYIDDFDEEEIGVCDNCGTTIYIGDIENEEIKLMIRL
jgi:hypothetical protein